MEEKKVNKTNIEKAQETLKYFLEKDCSAYTKTSPANKANYLSWSYAWQEFKKIMPFAYVTVKENSIGTYELKDSFGTFVVAVTVHNGGEKSGGEYTEESHTVILPIMDNKHKPMKAESYEYTTKFGTKTVAGATSFDTNYAIQRAKTKAISDFGLGLYIYHGETIPEEGDDFVGAVGKIAEITPEAAQAIFWKYLCNTGMQEKTINSIYQKINPSDYLKNGILSEDWKKHIDDIVQGFNEALTAQLIDCEVKIDGCNSFKNSIEEFKYLVELKNKQGEK